MIISLFLRSLVWMCVAALLSASSCQRDYSYLIDDRDNQKYITISIYAGMPDRLRALASASILAKSLGRRLVVEWPVIDGQMPAEFRELFNTDILEPSDVHFVSGSTLAEVLQLCDSNCSEVARFADPEDLTSPLAERFIYEDIPALSQRNEKVLWVKTLFSFKPKEMPFNDYLEQMREFYRNLDPVDSIRSQVKAFRETYFTSHMVGVHIRSSHGALEEVLEKLQEILDKQPHTFFYVAADSVDAVNELRQTFGSRILSFPIDTVNQADVATPRKELIDWLLLADTEYILGTLQSSLSDEAAICTKTRKKFAFGPANHKWFHSILDFAEDGTPQEGPYSRNRQSREHSISVDVVIPCAEKDREALNLAIKGARTHVANLGRVIVVSKERITHEAEWFPESAFPFQIQEIYSRLRSKVCNNGKFCNGGRKLGWIYQQLLKLYSPVVIPEISTNVLVLDADTIFLRPVHFVDEKDGASLFAVGTEYHKVYFEHAKRLFPFFRKVNANHSGIVHHMLFQRHVIEDIFRRAERIHNKPFWQAFIDEIDPREADASAASEYELYFNYVLDFTTLARIRELQWKNVGDLDLAQDTQEGFDFVSWQHYLRRT